MQRALTISDIMNKKYDLFEFEGPWANAFASPEVCGVWFVWGDSGNGKTTFLWQMVKYLSSFKDVIVNSLEEGSSHTVRKSFEELGMSNINGRVLLVEEDMQAFEKRLAKRKSPEIAVIDSFQYTQLNYRKYLDIKARFKNKLIIFISHADGKQPSGRSARSVMYDAKLKIWIEGYKAFSKGRYIGNTGEFIIWAEGAEKYWSKNKNKSEQL